MEAARSSLHHYLQPPEHSMKKRKNSPRPGLAGKPQLEASFAYLIGRDARLRQHHLQQRLPPASCSNEEKGHGATDLAAKIQHPTLRQRHKAN
jgi:hypothetical protein